MPTRHYRSREAFRKSTAYVHIHHVPERAHRRIIHQRGGKVEVISSGRLVRHGRQTRHHSVGNPNSMIAAVGREGSAFRKRQHRMLEAHQL